MFKKIIITCLFTLSIIPSYGQNNQPLDNCMQQILYSQMTENVVMDLPLILNISGIVYYQRVRIANVKVYYKSNVQSYNKLRDVALYEFSDALKQNFVINPSSTFYMKAYSNECLLFTLNYSNLGSNQHLKFESLKKKYTKTLKFENFIIKEINATKGADTIFKNEYVLKKAGGNTNNTTVNPVLNKNIGSQKLSYQYFNDQNQLSKIVNVNYKGKIDSTRYIYANNTLQQTEVFNGSNHYKIEFQHDSLLLLNQKRITTPKHTFLVNYSHYVGKNPGFISIKEDKSDKCINIKLEYNNIGKLIAAHVIEQTIKTGSEKLLSEFDFDYDVAGNIKNLREVRKNGKVKKQIEFVVGYPSVQ